MIHQPAAGIKAEAGPVSLAAAMRYAARATAEGDESW